MFGKTQKYYNDNPGAKAKKLSYDKKYQKTGYGRRSNILRKRARRKMVSQGKVRPHDGKDVDHTNSLRNGGSNGTGNLRVMNASANRAKDRPNGNRAKAKLRILINK